MRPCLSFIESRFSTKVEYEQWVKTIGSGSTSSGKFLSPRETKGQKARLFMAGQQTEMLQTEVVEWLNEGVVKGYESSKASMPPFNVGCGKILPGTLHFSVPVFGLTINDAAMELFALPVMREIAEKLHLRSPKYTLSTFVQGKLFKVRDLIAAARRDHPAADRATDRLEKFVGELEKLKLEQVHGRADWAAFVTRCGVEEGWEGRLHFDHLLSNFGFDAETAAALRHASIEVTDKKGQPETVKLENHALRWLGKALSCYQPDGCVADVVNLVFAMVHETPPAEYDEATTVETLKQFAQRLADGNFDGLWIPTHLHIDGELDDSMCWMVLRRVQDMMGDGDLRILLQLPGSDEPGFDGIADAIAQNRETLHRVRVIRDPDSRNAKAVTKGLAVEVGARSASPVLATPAMRRS